MFFVKNFKNVTNFFFKFNQKFENFVVIDFVRKIFSKREFHLLFDFFLEKKYNEQYFTIFKNCVKNKISFYLNKSIVQIVSIIVINIEFIDFNFVILDKSTLNTRVNNV